LSHRSAGKRSESSSSRERIPGARFHPC